MAYILRSLAVIGVIALNSPVRDKAPAETDALATAKTLVKAAGQINAASAMQGLSSAREAAQILAGLDPETRQRVLAMAVPDAGIRAHAPAGDAPIKTR